MNSTVFNLGALEDAAKAAKQASGGLVYGSWGCWAEGSGHDAGARFYVVQATPAESPVKADDDTVDIDVAVFVAPFPTPEAIQEGAWRRFDAETVEVTASAEIRGAIGRAVTHGEMSESTAGRVEQAIDAFLDALGIEHERVQR